MDMEREGNRAPDYQLILKVHLNGSIRIMVQVLASPILKRLLSKVVWIMVQPAYWFNFWWTKPGDRGTIKRNALYLKFCFEIDK